MFTPKCLQLPTSVMIVWLKLTMLSFIVAQTISPPQTSSTERKIPPDIRVYPIPLGIRVYPVNHPLAKQLNVEAESGAAIVIVRPGSLAEKAGLKPGDVIVKFADQKIDNCRQLEVIVKQLVIGKTYRVEFLRGGQLFFIDLHYQLVPPENTADTKEKWITQRAGNLQFEVPALWKPMKYLPPDEGVWSKEDDEGINTTFAVVRDIDVEQFIAALKVEKEDEITIAGQVAKSYCDTIKILDQPVQRKIIVLNQPGESQKSLVLICSAMAEQWPTVSATFQHILNSIRPAKDNLPDTASSITIVPDEKILDAEDEEIGIPIEELIE